MATTMDRLKVEGEPAPRTATSAAPASSALKAHKPGSALVTMDRTCQFVLQAGTAPSEMTITGLSANSTPVRKMEHLGRVRTANFGITTMDSPFMVNEEVELLTAEKPHFVICGLPVGSKDVNHRLYVNEERVGNYKTSAKAIYHARKMARASTAQSEPVMYSEKDTLPREDKDERAATNSIPPIPPTSPVTVVVPSANSRTVKSALGLQGHKFYTNQSHDWEHCTPQELLYRQNKINMMRREKTAGDIPVHRDGVTDVSGRHGGVLATVQGTVVNNGFTVSTVRKINFMRPGSTVRAPSRQDTGSTAVRNVVKINYNNPYRNTKHKERLALSSNKRIEFSSVDSYINYRNKKNKNGKPFMTQRAILRVPNPCSDTFLLQMMYDLNRPTPAKERRYVNPPGSALSAKSSDTAAPVDLEEIMQSRAVSNMSRTNANIERFQGKKSSISGKSMNSTKSTIDTETIEEEINWDIHVPTSDHTVT